MANSHKFLLGEVELKKILVVLLAFLMLLPIVIATETPENTEERINNPEDLAPNSRSAILMEASTGEILYQKNIHEKLSPASMTKIMTMLLIMEAIEAGKVSLDDTVVISPDAAGMGGSQIFLQIGTKMRVFELLKGIAVSSANDASVAMAEKIAGTESKFVELMNERARELGARNTNFKNSHGLDDADHYSTAYDLALISRELVKHEKVLEFTGIYEEYLNKPDGSSVWLVNTNRLVRFYDGMDGLKTGFTSIARYCLAATAKRNNLRLISVVMQVETPDKRSEDTIKLLNAGFNGYKINLILDKDAPLGKIKIENGKQEYAELQLMEALTELQKVTDDIKEYTFNIRKNKVKAPVESGQRVATLELIHNNRVVRRVPLTIREEVAKANLFNLIARNLKVIISGKNIF